MKWCVLTKPIDIKEPMGIYCNPGFDYFGESEEYIDHDLGLTAQDVMPFHLENVLKLQIQFGSGNMKVKWI